MKKIILTYSALFSVAFLTACSNTDSSVAESSIPHDVHSENRLVDNQAIKNDWGNFNSEESQESEVKIDVKSFTPHRQQRQNEREHTHNMYAAMEIRRLKPKDEVMRSNPFVGVLAAHNGVRIKQGLKPLRWSNKLADYSQQWVDHLGKGRECRIAHRTGNAPYGENLYKASSLRWSDGRVETLPVTIQNVVRAWTDEEKWYNHKTNSCKPGKKCGHYTQVVWRDTTEVGCAMKICQDKSQTWVCSYNPPGNFQGIRPY